jgi:phenylpropionate dioxygenase-like ring-hydroxylating dioxygenase large terminal subunit
MDGSPASWREPIEHYRSPARLAAELQMMRRHPTPFCPSAALPEVGSYVAREAAGTPLIAVRGADGRVCVLRNVSRDRGAPATRSAGGPWAFACHSYGWAYGLDGRLRHAPDDGVAPCLDQASPGFAPVHAIEHGGLVFVTQDLPSLAESSVDELLAIISPRERFYSITEDDVAANWKILAEGFIAGYHIRTTRRETVWPSGPPGVDNRTRVEASGEDRRVALSCQASARRRVLEAERVLTYAYHLFPNVMVVMLPDLMAMIALEPVATDRTRVVTYALSAHGDRAASPPEVAHAKAFLDAGVAEDRVIASAVQRRLANGGNTHVEFGRDEGALAQFHRRLHAMLARS